MAKKGQLSWRLRTEIPDLHLNSEIKVQYKDLHINSGPAPKV